MPDVTEPNDFARRFGQLVERYVISLGWTHQQVAHKVWGDSTRKSHVTAYIKGTKGKPSNPTIAKFVKALWITEADLEACRAPPTPMPPRGDEGSGLGSELIAELARQFDASAEAQGVLGWSDFLREKAAEYRSLKDEISELRGTNPRLDNQLAEAEDLMEHGRFRAAGEILQGAKEIAREVVREPLEQLSRLEGAQGRLAVLEGDHERGATHLINAARLFDFLDPDHAIALRQKLGQETELRSRRYGGVGAAAAVRIFRSIEEIASETERPRDWASAMNSAGIALSNQGARTGGEAGAALLGEAVAAYRAALRVRTEEAHPVAWAQTQNNLGIALREQGARTDGEAGAALLGEAVAAYRAALRVSTEAAHPVDWAETTENIGLAFESMAELEPEAAREHLNAALEAFEAALRVYDPVHMPYDFGTATQSRDRVAAKLA
ncbi:MAG: hypothetical protein AAF371_12110 [Pseudomonadota bacterium]